MRVGFLAVFTVLVLWANAQGYQDVAPSLGIVHTIQGAYNGAGASFADFDGDGWDDLSFCSRNAPMAFFRNTGNGFEPLDLVPATGEAKAILWADTDNDGDQDLLITFFEGPTKYYRQTAPLVFEDVSWWAGIPQDWSAMNYGACFGDYDRDGWLDLYICNYNWPSGATNWLLHNNGDGTFTDLSPTTLANDDSRRSFQSVFADIDRDLWPDIYVINDKFTRNSLYRNLGDGTFSDFTDTLGLGLLMESMSNTIGDYDRDGDLDIYVTNSYAGNALMRNDDSVFTDVAAPLGVAYHSMCWGAAFVDHALDGTEDLYAVDATTVDGNRNRFYVQAGGTFVDSILPGMAGDLTGNFAVARGDLDRNGAPDLLLTGEWPDGAKLWKSVGTTNKPLVLHLEGTVSNRDGIGAWVEVWTNGAAMHRYTMCGEGYLAQHSHDLFFGCGLKSYVDSVIVRWPSGITDRWCLVKTDQRTTLVEGQSSLALVAANDAVLCPGDSTTLHIPGAEEILWSDGWTVTPRTVDAAGSWSALCRIGTTWMYSDTLSVVQVDAWTPQGSASHPLCAGWDGSASVWPPATEGWSIAWNTASTEWTLGGVPAGTYTYTGSDANGCPFAGEITLSEPPALEASIAFTDADGGANGSATATAWGGTEPYSFSWNTGAQEAAVSGLAAGNYSCTITDAHGCTAVVEAVLIDLGVEEPSNAVVRLYPQPVRDSFTVGPLSGAQVPTVTDATGRVVECPCTRSADGWRCSTGALAAGSYVLRWSDPAGALRFVKE